MPLSKIYLSKESPEAAPGGWFSPKAEAINKAYCYNSSSSGCIFKPALRRIVGDVAKIRCCSLGGELVSIDEVVRGKTNLACLYCGGGLTTKKGAVKEHTLVKVIRPTALKLNQTQIDFGVKVDSMPFP